MEVKLKMAHITFLKKKLILSKKLDKEQKL
jgi:hypothetical protein